MGRTAGSPRLKATVTPEQWETATRANSAACLISDAFQREYPHLTRWSTDMVTIRATDRAAGVRYVWFTPTPAQDLLLSFDQGWTEPEARTVMLNGAVQVVRVRAATKAEVAERAERRVALEAKRAAGEELTATEVDTLATPDRPVSQGAQKLNGVGGRAVRKNPTKNPNLLAGRTRTFGAKLAVPSVVFQQAVEAEVAERVARLAAGTADALESDAAPTTGAGA